MSKHIADAPYIREAEKNGGFPDSPQDNKSKSCCHKNTHYEGWPDGGSIEVCEDCGMSRHHWEYGQSEWIMVEDIEGVTEKDAQIETWKHCEKCDDITLHRFEDREGTCLKCEEGRHPASFRGL